MVGKVNRHGLDIVDGVGVGGDPEQPWFASQFHYFLLGVGLGYANARGGVGLSAATRMGDKYDGVPIWEPGVAVAEGELRGSVGSIWSADSAGTTGTEFPRGFSGTVSDGLIDWTHVEHTQLVSLAGAFAVDSDINDGDAGWAMYLEAISRMGGGVFCTEAAGKNASGVTVDPTPYNGLFGVTGHWAAGGGDPLYGPLPTNPSGAAFNVGRNGQSWTVAWNVRKDGVAGTDGVTGFGDAGRMAKGHCLVWYTPSGVRGPVITSDTTTAAVAPRLDLTDYTLRVSVGAAIVGQVEGGADSVNYVRMIGAATGQPVELRADGTDTDIDLLLDPKGDGVVQIGQTFDALPGGWTADSMVTIKDASGSTFQIPAKYIA
jgi:hypothetical protein